MNLTLSKIETKDLLSIISLIEKSFDNFVAPTLSTEGVETFKKGITFEALQKRISLGNVFIVCRNESEICGVGEIRDNNHLNLLFVEPNTQRRGIGKKIFNELLREINETEITVNSSINAVKAYKKMGFIESDPSNEVKGIKYQPMIYKSENN